MDSLNGDNVKSAAGLSRESSERGSRRGVLGFVFVAVLGTVILARAGFVSRLTTRVTGEEFFGSNLAFFLLINFNIVVLLVLGYLIVRNVVKLVLDRRHNILGSRLRTRLVGAFVGLSLVPTILLFLVAKVILGTVLQGWFDPQFASSVESALTVARQFHQLAEQQVTRSVEHLSERLGVIGLLEPAVVASPSLSQPSTSSPNAPRLLTKYLEEKMRENGLAQLLVVDAHGETVAEVTDIARDGELHIPGINEAVLQLMQPGQLVVRPEVSVNGEFLRGYAPIVTAPGMTAKLYIVGTYYVPEELNSALTQVVDMYDDYKELGIYRRPLSSSYILTLLVVTLMVLLAAVWVGFYLARSLTVPIQSLAQGTDEVAHGNLDFRIAEVGDDELSILVRSFNKMTEDLKQTTDELVDRRRYMETVLERVGVGVVSIDTESRVTTANLAAVEMLGLPKLSEAERDRLIGAKLHDLVPTELRGKTIEMVRELFGSNERMSATNLSLPIRGETKHIQVTLTKLVHDRGGTLGAVILLDDLTELVSAQRVAAWREVARRIAHEIKNPLTPIQLSAQRIQRRLIGAERVGERSIEVVDDSRRESNLSAEEKKLVSECTETIVGQVESLRGLVNEFSRFARMPKSDPRPTELNAVIYETCRIFRESRPDIPLTLDLDPSVGVVDLDKVQIGRVLVNLLDNAVASIEAVDWSNRSRHNGASSAAIHVRTSLDSTLGVVVVNVSDNGIGIPDADKPKLFEPYFSRKQGGTGLGLAIVASIITDHNGFIRVRDNETFGVTVTFELPLHQATMRQRASGE